MTVPQRDAHSMAEAIRMILTQDDVSASMSAAARSEAATLGWPVVARSFESLATRLIKAAPTHRNERLASG